MSASGSVGAGPEISKDAHTTPLQLTRSEVGMRGGPKNEFVLWRCQLKYFPTWQKSTDKRIRSSGMNQLVKLREARPLLNRVARVAVNLDLEF